MLLEGDGASSTLDTYSYLLQELYTVTGLVKKNGTLAEAYVYDTYGKVTLWGYRNFDPALDTAPPARRADRFAIACEARGDESRVHRDGDVEKAENTYLVGLINANQPTSDPMADGDMDGDVDYTDSTMVVITSAGVPPVTLLTRGVGNQYYFTGAKLTLYEDYILGGVAPNLRVQYNRARWYDPDLGRWLQGLVFLLWY